MVQYDPFSEEVMDNPYPIYKQLRDESPIHYVEKYDCYAISRFEDVWNLSMSEDISTQKGTTPGQLLTKIQPVTPMLNLMDPPEHTQLRSPLRKFFTPGKVAKLEDTIRTLAKEMIEKARGTGSLDVASELASHVAVNTTCVVVGFPAEDGPALKRLVERFFSREEGVTGMTEDGVKAAMEINGYFMNLVQERRKKGIELDDAVNIFMNAVVEGRALSDEELGSHLSMLLIGGSETFPKVFSNLVKRLAENPDARKQCIEDPSLIPDAFNEGLRIDMPTQWLGRTMTGDVTMHDVTMREGQIALLMFPSANRDEREFDDPDTFNITRRPPRILSFGHGTHACLGMHVARLEGKICTEELLATMPDYELDMAKADWLRTEFVQGYMALPIRFEPC